MLSVYHVSAVHPWIKKDEVICYSGQSDFKKSGEKSQCPHPLYGLLSRI